MIEDLNMELERLENFSEFIGSAIVNRNGLLIASRMPREIDERKLGALSATIYEAIETAISILKTSEIKNLTIEYQDYQIIIFEVDFNTILVSLVDLNMNLGLLFIEIEEIIKNIKKLNDK
ncbi:MAG: roadblock/LC7 domain-containing protein [Candidatus Thorarchaeota archaeon]